MEEIKYEATFSSSVPCRWLFVIREDYAWVGGVETKKNGAGKRVCVGSTHYRYFFAVERIITSSRLQIQRILSE